MEVGQKNEKPVKVKCQPGMVTLMCNKWSNIYSSPRKDESLSPLAAPERGIVQQKRNKPSKVKFKQENVNFKSKDKPLQVFYPWFSQAFKFPIWMPTHHWKTIERVETKPGILMSKVRKGPFDPGG